MKCLPFSIESLLHNPIGRLSVIWSVEGDCKRVYIKGKGGVTVMSRVQLWIPQIFRVHRKWRIDLTL